MSLKVKMTPELAQLSAQIIAGLVRTFPTVSDGIDAVSSWIKQNPIQAYPAYPPAAAKKLADGLFERTQHCRRYRVGDLLIRDYTKDVDVTVKLLRPDQTAERSAHAHDHEGHAHKNSYLVKMDGKIITYPAALNINKKPEDSQIAPEGIVYSDSKELIIRQHTKSIVEIFESDESGQAFSLFVDAENHFGWWSEMVMSYYHMPKNLDERQVLQMMSSLKHDAPNLTPKYIVQNHHGIAVFGQEEAEPALYRKTPDSPKFVKIPFDTINEGVKEDFATEGTDLEYNQRCAHRGIGIRSSQDQHTHFSYQERGKIFIQPWGDEYPWHPKEGETGVIFDYLPDNCFLDRDPAKAISVQSVERNLQILEKGKLDLYERVHSATQAILTDEDDFRIEEPYRVFHMLANIIAGYAE